MPSPQPNVKSQARERPTYEEMLWEQLQDTKTEVRETRKKLNQRMDRLERRMDKLEEEMKTTRQELNTRIDRLADKIDALKNKTDDNRRLLPRISAIDLSYIGITLGVLYALIIK